MEWKMPPWWVRIVRRRGVRRKSHSRERLINGVKTNSEIKNKWKMFRKKKLLSKRRPWRRKRIRKIRWRNDHSYLFTVGYLWQYGRHSQCIKDWLYHFVTKLYQNRNLVGGHDSLKAYSFLAALISSSSAILTLCRGGESYRIAVLLFPSSFQRFEVSFFWVMN